MKSVTLVYLNGQMQSLLLADIPRLGDRIRLLNGQPSPSLVVIDVLWKEIDADKLLEPSVFVSVRPHDDNAAPG